MSGRKNVLIPKHLMVDGDMSGSLVTDVVSALYQDNIGFQVEWTGSPSGSFAIEASIDYNDVSGSGTFYELTFNPILGEAGGSAGGFLINLNQFPYPYYRLTYEPVGSSGSLNVYICSKEI